jgi:antitoxin component HigA of HigAB toxin-antitoxin module
MEGWSLNMPKIPEKYLELIETFRLRPIRDDADLKRAEKVMRKLIVADNLSPGESDYLEVLGNLIEEYEEKAHAIEPLPPHKMLAGLMEMREVNQSELSKATGIPISTISEILSQRREMNLGHVARFCGYFSVEPGVFVQPKTELASK